MWYWWCEWIFGWVVEDVDVVDGWWFVLMVEMDFFKIVWVFLCGVVFFNKFYYEKYFFIFI